MSEPAPPVDGRNSLVISVNREKSGDGKNWYSVNDWIGTEPLDFLSLPMEIQDEFNKLARQGTVGAVAKGWDENHAPILLYLLNITAMQYIYPAPGAPGQEIHGFIANLSDQTILLYGALNGGADVYYRKITQANWSARQYCPGHWDSKIQNIVDGLITTSNLAVDVEVDSGSGPGVSITCYLLNLASFADPPGR